jgi:hypothetical protein
VSHALEVEGQFLNRGHREAFTEQERLIIRADLSKVISWAKVRVLLRPKSLFFTLFPCVGQGPDYLFIVYLEILSLDRQDLEAPCQVNRKQPPLKDERHALHPARKFNSGMDELVAYKRRPASLEQSIPPKPPLGRSWALFSEILWKQTACSPVSASHEEVGCDHPRGQVVHRHVLDV